ncbi:MAG: gamma-glutamyl-gamma-aminobutyrate hydrolase family protein [Myxococcota bacterium]|jgi:putative glutamine amidotransferase
MPIRKFSRPLVGITADFDTNWPGERDPLLFHRLKGTYVDAVIKAGGDPVIIPSCMDYDRGIIDRYTAILDGVVVSGSRSDIDPALQCDAQGPCGDENAFRRHSLEIGLTRAFIDAGRPVLGICGGEQILNVAMGGTLVAHIPDEIGVDINHAREYFRTSHRVTAKQGSLLHSIVGADSFEVNSTHHQAVRGLGASLAVSAESDDGVIEAIELPARAFVLGVQWHPEALGSSDASVRIFRAFSQACKDGMDR